MGAAFFMLFGIVTYAMQRGKRDFTSTSQVVATNYDVVVSVEAAHEARRLLQQLPMTRSDAAAGPRPRLPQADYYGQPDQQPGQQPGPAAGPARARRPCGRPAGTTPTDSRVPARRAPQAAAGRQPGQPRRKPGAAGSGTRGSGPLP